jgi:hypothetical protein
MGCCLLVSVDVNVNVAVETLVFVTLVVEVLVLAAGVKAVLTAFFEAVLAAVVGLVYADILFLGEASWAAAVVFSGGDADVLAEVLLVTGRAGLLGWWWLLTFPSSALDRYLLLSLDLYGRLVVFVGRRKDAERDSVGALAGVRGHDRHRQRCDEAYASAPPVMNGAKARASGGVRCDLLGEYSRDSGVEIQPGDFWGTRILCKTATRLAKQRSLMRGGVGGL